MDKIAQLLKEAKAVFYYPAYDTNGTPWNFALKIGTLNEESNSNIDRFKSSICAFR